MQLFRCYHVAGGRGGVKQCSNDDVLKKRGVVRSAVVGQEKCTPFHFPVGGFEVNDSSVSCPTPPPFVRFSISFACGQIRAICRPAGFPDGEGGKSPWLIDFALLCNSFPPFLPTQPSGTSFCFFPFFQVLGITSNTPIKLNAVGHGTWNRDSTLKLARANFLAPFLATVPRPPYLQLGGGLGSGTRTAEATL